MSLKAILKKPIRFVNVVGWAVAIFIIGGALWALIPTLCFLLAMSLLFIGLYFFPEELSSFDPTTELPPIPRQVAINHVEYLIQGYHQSQGYPPLTAYTKRQVEDDGFSGSSWRIIYESPTYVADYDVTKRGPSGVIVRQLTQQQAINTATQALKERCQEAGIDCSTFTTMKTIHYLDHAACGSTWQPWGIQFDSPDYTFFVPVNYRNSAEDIFYWPKRSPVITTKDNQKVARWASEDSNIPVAQLSPPQAKKIGLMFLGESKDASASATGYKMETPHCLLFHYLKDDAGNSSFTWNQTWQKTGIVQEFPVKF